MRLFLIFSFLVLGGCNSTFVDVANEALPKTVMIDVTANVVTIKLTLDENKNIVVKQSTESVTFSGAGALISENGYILSCAHLFRFTNIESISVGLLDGRVLDGELLYKDYKKDLGLVTISTYTPDYFKRVRPGKLKVGEDVIFIGAPLNFTWSVSKGIISALNRDFDGWYNFVQTDIALNPGNSGGPLINKYGELVGIASMIISPVNAPINTGIGMAVSPDEINIFLAKFRGLNK